MQRSFLSGLFLIILLNLLVKPFYILGIDAEVQNRVGEAVYGDYFSLLNFSFLLNILLDLGITNYNTQSLARNPQLLSKHFGKLLSLRMFLFILYAAFTLLSGAWMGYNGHEFYILFILVINQFLVAIIQFCRSNFAGLHLFYTDALVSILDRSLLIIFCSILLWTNLVSSDFDIVWFVYAQTLAYLLTAMLAILVLFLKSGQIKLKLSRSFSWVILKNTFPYALLILLMMMYNRIDSVMLERMLADGDIQAGIYAQGFRYFDAVNMFALLFAGILLPVFARYLKAHKAVDTIVYQAVRLLIGASVFVGIITFLFRENLLQLRYENVTEASVASFGFLILSFIPVSLTYIFGTLLTANQNLRQLNYMAVTGVILNVLLNLFMIPILKSEGAALATFITQWFTALIQIVLAFRILKLPVNYKVILSLVVLAASLVGTYFIVKYMQVPFQTSLLLVFVIGVLVYFSLGFFKMNEIKEIFKKN